MSECLLNVAKVSPTYSTGMSERFQILVEWFSGVLKDHGLNVQPYRGNSPSFFNALPPEKKVLTLRDFTRYLEVCAQTLHDGKLLTDDKAFLWRFIKYREWRQTSDLFSLFEKDDVIEIYDLNSYVQIFRNLRFFSVCSYTLDDILCRPFWELYHRDEIITNEIIGFATKLHRQEVNATIKYDRHVYAIDEIDSPMLYHCHVENRFIAPLVNSDGRTVTAVHVIRCHSLLPKIGFAVKGIGSGHESIL